MASRPPNWSTKDIQLFCSEAAYGVEQGIPITPPGSQDRRYNSSPRNRASMSYQIGCSTITSFGSSATVHGPIVGGSYYYYGSPPKYQTQKAIKDKTREVAELDLDTGEDDESTDSKPQINRKIILRVSTCIGVNWKMLGREMELEDYELDSIEENNRGKGVAEMAYQMLLFWKEKNAKNATVEALVEHLQEVNRNDLAEDIVRIINRTKSTSMSSQE